jgi:hypothetical protein
VSFSVSYEKFRVNVQEKFLNGLSKTLMYPFHVYLTASSPASAGEEAVK